MTEEPVFPLQDSARLGASDIAEIAGVGASAVSNWRRRHPDFPKPIEEGSGGDLFEWGEVRRWLDERGKAYGSLSWAQVFWKAANVFRESIDPQVFTIAFLQLFLLRAGAGGAASGRPSNSVPRDAWRRIEEGSPTPLAAWNRIIDEIRDSDASLGRALEPVVDYPDRLLATLVQYVRGVEADVNYGRLASGILARFQQSNWKSGTGFTPPTLSKLLVSLVGGAGTTFYDPACGMAMVLAEAWAQQKNNQLRLYGQEINEHAWRLGYLHLALLDANFTLVTGDTLLDDQLRDLRADSIVLDPPFGHHDISGGLSATDKRWFAGVPKRHADWLWVQHCVFHLEEVGLGAIVLPRGAAVRGGTEAGVRRKIIEAGVLRAVVDLPTGLFPGTSVAACVMIVGSRASREGSRPILFLDATQLGEARRGQLHELSDEDVHLIHDTVSRALDGADVNVPRFATSRSVADVLEQGGSLLPSEYIRYATPVRIIDDEPIGARLGRLRNELGHGVATVGPALDSAHGLLMRFKETGAENIPHDDIELGDLLLLPPQRGRRRKENGDDSMPIVTGDDVHRTTPSGYCLRDLPQTITHTDVGDRVVRRGDLLLPIRGFEPDAPIPCVIVDFSGSAAFDASLMRLRFDPERMEPHYARLFITSRQGRQAVAAASSGVAASRLQPKLVSSITVPVPPLAVQRSIVEAVRQIGDEWQHLVEASDTIAAALDTAREGVVGGAFIVTGQKDRG
jgi:type I restriction enzyme M protein